MRQTIIADTSGLFSLFSENDQNHRPAIKISKQIEKNNDTLIIPADVLTELINILGKKVNHKEALKRGKQIIEQYANICDSNHDIRQAALKLFAKQAESVSFTDCIVMAIADVYETKIIFGFDKIFSKNGYPLP